MSMTMVEKILADHAGRSQVEPGDIVEAEVDLVLGNDITTPVAIDEFVKIGVDQVFDRSKIALVPDHFAPNKDIQSAEQCKRLRDFADKYEIENYFEVGEMGIEHCLLPEKGLVLPGQIVIGADSHTCTYGAFGALGTGIGSTDMAAAMAAGETWFKVPPTIKINYQGELDEWVEAKDLILYTIGDLGVDGALYKALEFTGEVIESLSMAGRMTVSNMAIEAGAKCGLIAPDSTTENYLAGRTEADYECFYSDENADYEREINYDVGEIEPQVAFPHLPENTRNISDIDNIAIDQVVIGSCTNGRLEDLRTAAGILEDKVKSNGVRLVIFPGTQEIYRQAVKEGIIETLVAAGAAVSTPTCGPCLGGHMGVLAEGERAVSTTNRNFVGRMGHPESGVYLTGAAAAAASAVAGRIASPEEVM
ncbi:3-isopropylmalate dehydratase large subunit [Halarsenatibacter silvermanii]|uniref:3-isopropylmalate dehydratase large subunit n=1 Tax=Halarsenatibacter silvermanii TaxID=321763 RepID=A0A1G9QV86_9FIRM|nr:3-isopropylmalate dehydratase large subunit [Halarsenatibacter silvermanii]SDM14175.1 3-isopropylmalate dehydratase, large subunit [Halarsenatibacter silvermanii]